jgi:hypothetical protein
LQLSRIALESMDAEFAIVADRSLGTLRVTMSGFFDHGSVEAFVRDVHLKLDQLGARPNEHLMLCDVRRMKIQTQDVVRLFSAIVGSPRLRSKRLAFVTGSSLSRLQAKRLTDRAGVLFFSDVAAAEEWLFDEPTSARLPARADSSSECLISAGRG